MISIHASAREATGRAERGKQAAVISIHASAREATSQRCWAVSREWISIHASAREATNLFVQYHQGKLYFNPRLREGGDQMCRPAFQGSFRFQSTPPRGRRHVVWRYCDGDPGFQSTPPRGRRHPADLLWRRCTDFNPRLREGGDAMSVVNQIRQTGFQSTPPRGRRRYSLKDAVNDFLISIHASAREATAETYGARV